MMEKYLSYLKKALPAADQIAPIDGLLAEIVDHALHVRSTVPWGKSIPDSIFQAFVLFPRVNNEDLVLYHRVIWGELEHRLQGLSMDEAVREVNFWCYEHATYQTTDNRTANALTVMRRAYGRCGEESVLLVCALRACGIPARQVYVPRWAHCDDNHAWVEAWVDGVWRYLGACEPEPVLDSGWFTAAASKAMLLHTRAYGVDPEGERIENRDGDAREINRTAAYAQTQSLTVQVVRDGQPLPGVFVCFELLNEAELYPIITKTTDADGKAELLTGLGTLHLHVHDGARYVETMVQVAEQDEITLSFDNAVAFETAPKQLNQHPPKESRIQQSVFSDAIAAAHAARMKAAEAKRAAYEATFDTSDPLLASARGNHAVIRRFLDQANGDEDARRELLSSLREKDLVDATEELLTDALTVALPHRDRYPHDVWVESVLCPRVLNEMMYPDRAWLRDTLGSFADGHAVWQALADRLTLCDMNPITLFPRMRDVLAAGRASTLVRDVLFVNLCRANGIAARLNPVTGEKELWKAGSYHTLLPQRQPNAVLALAQSTGREKLYAVDFTVAELRNGVYHTMLLRDVRLEDRLEIPVHAGSYRVLCCTRQIDGSVDAWVLPVQVAEGKTAELSLCFRPERTEELMLRADLPPLPVEGDPAVLPRRKQPSIIAMLAPGQEPTEHFLNELLDAKTLLQQMQLRVDLLIEQPADAANAKLQRVLSEIPTAALLLRPDKIALTAWRRMLNAGDLRLPLAVAVDADGCGRFAFVNYHVGSVMSLIRMIGRTES